MPGTPLERAQHRAWIAASGELLGNLYTYMTSKDVLEVEEAKNELWDILGKLEETVTGEGFFAARGFSLVDSAFAPVFLRLLHMKSLRDDPTWKNLPKTKRLAQALIELPEVRDSVIPEFYERYRTYLKKHGALMASDWT
jgi:glutathione S-transferase